MSAPPIDLQAVRQALATFDQALEDFPELGAPNPERWEAFQQWQHTHQEERTMPRKPTGRPRGRPKGEPYGTLLARMPKVFIDRVKRYAGIHRQDISAVIRDALELLLNESDPRTHIGYDSNAHHETVPHVTERPAANGTSHPAPSSRAATGATDTLPHSVEPVPEVAPRSSPLPSAVGEDLPFDATKHRLGRLCPRGHEYGTTGQSLRYNNKAGGCLQCDAEKARERRRNNRLARAGG